MIGIAILFIVLGILIKYGKMYFLIAGYNTMSKEEKIELMYSEELNNYNE